MGRLTMSHDGGFMQGIRPFNLHDICTGSGIWCGIEADCNGCSYIRRELTELAEYRKKAADAALKGGDGNEKS